MASHLEQDYVLPTGFKEIFHQPARPGNPNQGKYFGDESSVNHNHVGKDGFRQHHQNFTKLSNGLSCGWERNKTSMEQECGGVNLDRKKQTHLEEPPATAEDSLLFVADYKRTEKAASSQEASDSARSCESSATRATKGATCTTSIHIEPTPPVGQNKEDAFDFSNAAAEQTPAFSSGAVRHPSPAPNDRMKPQSLSLSNEAKQLATCGWGNRPISASLQSFQPADMHV